MYSKLPILTVLVATLGLFSHLSRNMFYEGINQQQSIFTVYFGICSFSCFVYQAEQRLRHLGQLFFFPFSKFINLPRLEENRLFSIIFCFYFIMVCSGSETINLGQSSPKGFPFSASIIFHVSYFIHFFSVQVFSRHQPEMTCALLQGAKSTD